MALLPTRSKLDEIASRDEQNAWLTSPLKVDASPSRAPPKLADDPYDERIRLLLDAPEWPAFAALLRGYIENAIFEPFETEGRWWNVTIAEGGASVHVNIWRQWVLLIDFRADQVESGLRATGLVYVDAEALDAELKSGQPLIPCFTAEETTLKGNLRRQKAIRIASATIDQLAELFNSDWMISATRTLNLDLMRGGQLGRGQRDHLRKLVDAVFAEDLITNRENAVEAQHLAEESEYQRLVWLRKNQAKFSVPVKALWNNKCAVSGIESASLLEACHIKPFSDSELTPAERFDLHNGLCLAAHIHAAFDAELIGFSPTGEVRFSKRLSLDDRKRMNLADGIHIEVTEQHRPYLEYRYAKFLEANE